MQPTPEAPSTLRPSVAAIWLSLLGVFLIDVLMDPLFVDASLYVVPVVMTLWLPTTRVTLAVTVAALILAGATLAADIGKGAPAVHAITRGLLEVAPVLAAAVAVIARKRGEERAAARFREWRELANASPVLMRGANADGTIIYANRGWYELTGAAREQLLGRPLGEIAVKGQADLAQAVDEASLRRVMAEAEYGIQVAGRGTVWIFERITPRLDATGRLVGFVGSGIDVTERHAALRTVSENRERLAEAEQIAELGNVDYVLATGRPVWSDGLFRLLGLPPGSIQPSVGTFMTFVVPEDREGLLAAMKETGATGVWPDRRVRILRKDGRVRELKVRARMVLGTDGKPLRVFGTLQDITERQVMEKALLEHQSNLAKAQQIAKLGSWSMDLRTGAVLWSEQMYRLAGMPENSAPPSVEDFVERIVHTEDREAFLAGLARCARVAAAGGQRVSPRSSRRDDGRGPRAV